MSKLIGQLDLSGTAEERTWRIVINTPVGGGEGSYVIDVHREIVVKNASGETVQRIRSEEMARELLPQSKFRARRSFGAAAAMAKSNIVLPTIRDTIEHIIEDQKAGE